ncbi:hypothetical protein EAF04_008275 [Stromatinia cepivora]|nr:hypothetical protein EAF04_008275 [Stromatinia cepivora]
MFSKLRSTEYSYSSIGDRNEDGPVKGSVHGAFFKITFFWRDIVIFCLCLTCGFLTFEAFLNPFHEGSRAHVQSYELTSGDTRWRQFQWHTNIYSSDDPKDSEAISAAWDRIVPAHGFVAVDREWAEEHNLPASMSLPSDSSKGVYVIDAYHQVHCITIIRKTLSEVASGQDPSVPLQHSWHCFDSLLQYVMCGTSGDTLLYTWGRNQTGSGQLRRCIDWNSRKNWAKENSACYWDGDKPIPLYDHFGRCGGDDDGIRVAGTW